MTAFTLGHAELGTDRPIPFEDFVGIIKGRSIVSAASWSNGRVEFGLSGGLQLRIVMIPGRLELNLVSTTNPGEIPPLAVALGDLPQRVSLRVVEAKLSALRSLYAAFLLVNTGRVAELGAYYTENPNGDIESDLLTPDDRLYIESLSYGPWVVVLWTKSRSALTALFSVAGLSFTRGRDAFLRKMEGEANLIDAQVEKQRIENERARFDLGRIQADYLLQVTDQISDPRQKDAVRAQLILQVANLTLDDQQDADSAKRLPPP